MYLSLLRLRIKTSVSSFSFVNTPETHTKCNLKFKKQFLIIRVIIMKYKYEILTSVRDFHTDQTLSLTNFHSQWGPTIWSCLAWLRTRFHTQILLLISTFELNEANSNDFSENTVFGKASFILLTVHFLDVSKICL